MILSVSRRTDIPAFYSEWFINRLKAGFVYVRNPMNIYQISSIPLTPNNIDCIVFWTKDPKPLLEYLNDIDKMGYKYYFQFTITPYRKDVEPSVRDKRETIKTFKNLSERIGKEKVILRYDPIFITDKGRYTHKYHAKAFRELCNQLHAHTDRVVISFLDGYHKISKNVKEIGIRELTCEDMLTIAENFSNITRTYGLELETCAEQIPLEKFGIKHSKCIDGDLIGKILNQGLAKTNKKDGERQLCGCMPCIDIGQYDTCMHKCLYCYANINKYKATENYKIHSPTSPLILGQVDKEKDKIYPRKESETKSFKLSVEKIKQLTTEDFLKSTEENI